jgi:hypothetical protein
MGRFTAHVVPLFCIMPTMIVWSLTARNSFTLPFDVLEKKNNTLKIADVQPTSLILRKK